MDNDDSDKYLDGAAKVILPFLLFEHKRQNVLKNITESKIPFSVQIKKIDKDDKAPIVPEKKAPADPDVRKEMDAMDLRRIEDEKKADAERAARSNMEVGSKPTQARESSPQEEAPPQEEPANTAMAANAAATPTGAKAANAATKKEPEKNFFDKFAAMLGKAEQGKGFPPPNPGTISAPSGNGGQGGSLSRALAEENQAKQKQTYYDKFTALFS